jgi:hypothetical protein
LGTPFGVVQEPASQQTPPVQELPPPQLMAQLVP